MTGRASPKLAMGMALLLSLVAHGWLLLRPVPMEPVLGDAAASGIAIEIVAHVPATQAARPPAGSEAARDTTPVPPVPVSAPAPRRADTGPTRVARSKPVMDTEAAPPAAREPDRVVDAPAAETAPPAAENANAAADARHLLAHIKADLARHFQYPRIARQRGWEGEVILGFMLMPDGRITTIRILKSSGFFLLDQAARQSLARVARIQLARRMSAGSQLELPVQYRLTDS